MTGTVHQQKPKLPVEECNEKIKRIQRQILLDELNKAMAMNVLVSEITCT